MVESKINVTVRIKPLKEKEAKNDRNNNVWKKVSDSTLINTRTKEAFSYDQIFGPEITTETIFNEQVKELVHNALDGINQTVFAYGQTSSGKTFTMRGYPEKNQLGLIPLSVKEIFDTIEADTTRDYQVSVSYMEVSFAFHILSSFEVFPQPTAIIFIHDCFLLVCSRFTTSA